MEVINIINKFEDSIEEATTLPFSSKKILDRELIETFLEEMRCHLPEDIKKAKWIQDERAKILSDSKIEREKILSDASDLAKQMVDESEIVREAQENARKIIDDATDKALGIRSGAKEYASGILDDLQSKLHDTLEKVEVDKRELQKY